MSNGQKKRWNACKRKRHSASKSDGEDCSCSSQTKGLESKTGIKRSNHSKFNKEETEPEPASKIVPREKKLEYAVQLSASAKKIRSGGGKWDQVDNVMIRYENNLYKYQVGALNTYEDALATKAKLKSLGFTDCFVVAYYNDQLIQVKEALALSN